jgi:kynurenine formamidase
VLTFEAEHGPIQPGTVVLLRTGWDRHYQPGDAGADYCHNVIITGTSPGWPAPEPPLMQLLMDRGVRCVGTDGASMGSAHDGAPVHLLGLGAGLAFVEALAHLDQLPPRGAYFCFAPLNVARGTGAPGRAFAWLPPASSTTGEGRH